MRPLAAAVLAVSTAMTALAGCTADPVAPRTFSPAPPSPAPTPRDATPAPAARWTVDGEPQTLAEGLDVPWSMAETPDGALLVSQRDAGEVVAVSPGGDISPVGRVPGVVPGGEAGLLGLAIRDTEEGLELYAYHSAEDDNRIVRMPLRRSAGGWELGPTTEILTGIPRASNHDGGRIAFGPDGMLYATTGDANRTETSRDPASLGGKILRMTPDGARPADNPFPGSLAWTIGHRNPQGIAWDASGRLWAAEFGQNTWDELNLIEPGGDYGWPDVEGAAGESGLRDPVAQWPTDEASPSGIAAVGDTVFVAGLGGERLWVVTPDGAGGAETEAFLVDGPGRLRDVQATDEGLRLLTGNTDGRGEERDGDDRLLLLGLSPTG